MVEAGRAPPPAAAMTPARALGQALALAAQEMMDLPLQVERAEDLRLSLAELLEVIEPLALLAVLEGPREALGLAVLAPATLATLIEMQTMGRIGPSAAEPRRPTRTDAAMSAGFLDRVLGEFETLLAADEAITWAGGFRYGSFLDVPRPLGLVLEESGYQVLRLTLAFGSEAPRQGAILLALPLPGRGGPPVVRRAAGAEGPGAASRTAVPSDAAGVWRACLDEAVMQAPAELHAVMGRISLPLSAVLALTPGALIELPADALTQLRVEGADGRLLTLARLGQMRGHRALRLKSAVETSGAADDPGDDAGAAGAPSPAEPWRQATVLHGRGAGAGAAIRNPAAGSATVDGAAGAAPALDEASRQGEDATLAG